MRSRIQDLLGDDPSQGRYSDDIYPSEKMGGHLRRARLKIFFSEYSKARERRISLGELAREKKISMVELEEKERCPLVGRRFSFPFSPPPPPPPCRPARVRS